MVSVESGRRVWWSDQHFLPHERYTAHNCVFKFTQCVQTAAQRFTKLESKSFGKVKQAAKKL